MSILETCSEETQIRRGRSRLSPRQAGHLAAWGSFLLRPGLLLTVDNRTASSCLSVSNVADGMHDARPRGGGGGGE